MKDRIVVTAMGLETALGNTLPAVWAKLLQGQSAARSWQDLEEQGFRYATACRVAHCDAPALRRGRHLLGHALSQALANTTTDLPENTGVFIGSTMGESAAFEAKASGESIDVSQYNCASFTRYVQERLGLKGPSYAFGTACAAGNYAIGYAARQLASGKIDAAIAGGVDAFSRIAMAGFSRARAMSPVGECRAYDAKRSGMLLGEGAAVLVLQREADAKANGAKILASIEALGLSADAYHATAPEPEGEGIERAIRAALQEAQLSPEAIAWVCGHGSGTRASDLAESKALARVFGSQIGVAAYKGAFGHTLGAATAIESICCILALQTGSLAPSSMLVQKDEQIAVNVIREVYSHQADYVLNCGYAFGGLNSALIIGKA